MNDSEQAIRLDGGWNEFFRMKKEDPKCMYYFNNNGKWYLYLYPFGAPGCLSEHTVVEYDDTISVSPSILLTAVLSGVLVVRHGYLTEGAWFGCSDDGKGIREYEEKINTTG